jgi:putative nucleotidyltransferase with HDIG domain
MIAFSVLSPIMFVSLAVLNFIADMAEKAELRDSLIQTSDVTEKLVDQISITHNNATAVKEVAAVLKPESTVDNILKDVTDVLRSKLDFERCAILLANHGQTRLTFRDGYGYSNQELEQMSDLSFHLDNPDSRGFLVRCFWENKPMLINELDSYLPRLSERSQTIASQMNVRSLICCPICVEEKPIGVLMMDNPLSDRPLVETDLNLIEGVAPAIGISLHNVNLLKAQEDQFETLLKVMSASIDARDSLTRGHSEKVTEYALAICRVMKLDPDFRETIRVAALLHDYGKLAVPDNVLKKPGKLTSEEYEQIKAHAAKTGDILRQINFAESLSKVPVIAEAHHEKMDGSGYPYGLKGEEIPLGARIIAVADVFEALTAKRHYRESLSTEVALSIMRKDVNRHFDPDVFAALELSLKNNVFSIDRGTNATGIKERSSALAH